MLRSWENQLAAGIACPQITASVSLQVQVIAVRLQGSCSQRLPKIKIIIIKKKIVLSPNSFDEEAIVKAEGGFI